MPYKIRFNLGKGENFLKWKVTDPDGNHRYYDPKEVSIAMTRCKLINHKGTAQKIYDGANKTVCAWIKAEHVVVARVKNVFEEGDIQALKESLDQVSYNPRITPNWVMGGKNVDDEMFNALITLDRTVVNLAKKKK